MKDQGPGMGVTTPVICNTGRAESSPGPREGVPLFRRFRFALIDIDVQPIAKLRTLRLEVENRCNSFTS